MFNNMNSELQFPSLRPNAIPFHILEKITNGFSDNQKIGSGGFGVVYKGVFEDGREIAVKKFHHGLGLGDNQFQNEIENMMRLKHQNIVQLVGYCYEIRHTFFEYEGKQVLAGMPERLICLEYLHNRSLEEYISDESGGLDWCHRFEIIKGICEGLRYLHEGEENCVYHMDLKPANILLDRNMVPKIADFGLSRLFHGSQIHVTKNIAGTLGYMPKEYISHGKISKKVDIFSLGVIIIEIMTGPHGLSKSYYMPSQEFIEQVHGKWRNILQEEWRDSSLECYCQQVKRCIRIALNCVEDDWDKRPSIGNIICALNESETVIQTLSLENALLSVNLQSSRLEANELNYTEPNVTVEKEVKLMAASCDHSEKVTGFERYQEVLSIDVNPGKPWILTNHQKSHVSICNYHTQSTINSFQAMKKPEQMAEVLLPVVSKIGSTLAEEVTKMAIRKLSEKVPNLNELPVKMKEIGNELTMMDSFIQKISIPSQTDEFVKCWIAEVRLLAHRVEDVTDKYSYHSHQMQAENAVKKILSKAYYVSVFSEIVEEIIMIEKHIENVFRKKERWLHPSQLKANPLVDIKRMQSQDCLLDAIPDDLVGIEENRILLTQWLYSKKQNGNVITVSGMGGLGKSTLVRNLYEWEKYNFRARAWIVVSQMYNVVEMLRKLLRKMGGPEQSQVAAMDAHDLKERIKQQLKHSKKCLIVLDDVWNPDAYTQISNAFRDLQACCVIITTRQENVAALADPTRQLKLKPLEHSDAFALFCRKAFRYSTNCMCPQELMELADNVVVRCQGLPLAIVSIGGLLSRLQPTRHVWNETYKQLRNELINNDGVRAVLNLSYHDLPGDLRSCFIYCALFPEDHQFYRESLVRLWVAERFAVQKEESTPEEVADRYLRELIQRNMIEVVEKDELGRVSTCKMHGIVRDLALSVAREEKFGFANDFSSMVTMDKDVRRLSLCGRKHKNALKLKIQFERLRTLVAVGMIASPELLTSIVSGSKYLTAIELQDSEISEVPDSIGELFNLRYIGLRRTNIRSLPESIGKLSNLHTLDIKQTKIEKLPQNIVKIKKLRHLLADRYADEKQSEFRYFFAMQAPKHLANLEELQTLETVEASNELAEQLRKLLQLRSAWIDNIRGADCRNIFTALSKMPFLSSLLLSASDEKEELCLEALKPESKSLYRLIIRGCWAQNTLQCPIFHNHGENLKYIALSWCNLNGDPLQLLAPHVPNLSSLSLNRVRSASTLVLSAGYFTQLKTLVLKRMANVNQLEIRDGALPEIEGLYVVNLPNLNEIPQGIQHLRSLKKLWLANLHQNFRYQWDACGMQQKMQYVPELRIWH